MSKTIKSLSDVYENEFYDIDIDPFWNTGEQTELKAHRIHAYPAKFPAFISGKGLEYVAQKDYQPQIIADIFCGCGTVAFEAARKSIDFWGCDINPVATMIARAKSKKYDTARLTKLLNSILLKFDTIKYNASPYGNSLERLKYWFFEKEYDNLFKLKQSIDETTSPRSKYRLFFYCAFSNILKATSRWLTKSIKPQLDPDKSPADVITVFIEQCQSMINAYKQIEFNNISKTKIITGNFLDKKIKRPKVDMIISSPPYVTSYEYADLHQLSSLWLGFADDYRSLRYGSIGTLYHNLNFEIEASPLSKIGHSVVAELYPKDKRQARSVAKYFCDMQDVIKGCIDMLNDNAFLLLVIGDTEYKGVHIENARHVAELMLSNGFKDVNITKRKVSGKILTPYRDSLGRFTTDSSGRKVYGEEFIVLGQKS